MKAEEQDSSKKKELLKSFNVGSEVAEDERAQLNEYFIQTAAWQRIREGKVDLVRGAKGSGKSAIYVLLLNHQAELRDSGTLVIQAEELAGNPVFQDIARQDPPASEGEFLITWKIYFLVLVAQQIQDLPQLTSEPAVRLIDSLFRAGLLDSNKATLPHLARAAVNYAKRLVKRIRVEGNLSVDPTTGLPLPTMSVKLGESDLLKATSTELDFEALFEDANQALSIGNLSAWILLDRLDVAFRGSVISNPEVLESNALRALLRAYIDLKKYNQISLKVFLREDVWDFITSTRPFPEASHVTKEETLRWEPRSLINLIARRLAKSENIRHYYQVTQHSITRSPDRFLNQLLGRFSPKDLDPDPKQTPIDNVLSQISDGKGMVTPREVIHFMNEVAKAQLRVIEEHESEPDREENIGALFEIKAIEKSIKEVSERKLNTYLYAEYPVLKRYMEALRGFNREISLRSLTVIWECEHERAIKVVDDLIQLRVMRRKLSGVNANLHASQIVTGRRSPPLYEVVALYALALDMRAGAGLLDLSGGS